MNAIHALRASLAGDQISDEDCFMVMEPNLLGFHMYLTQGKMTQQVQELPGHI
jgi:hypothetical protein